MRIPIVVSVFLFVVDQLTKRLVVEFVDYGHSVAVIKTKSFFNIVNISNSGAAFSILQDRNVLFSILISSFLVFIIFYIYKNRSRLSKLQKYSYCFIASCWLGNRYDRLARGAVVDFLDFGINSLRWPAFNIADSCICVAVGLLFIDLFLCKNKI
jgi:signal peptidase II